MTTRRKFLAAAEMAVLPFVGLSALAQVRNKPVSLVVGFPPGGSGDTVARAIAQQLHGRYAPAVVVENRPGAGGRIALQHVKAAEPTGDVLIQVPMSTLMIYPYVYPNLLYDPVTDFTPVARIAKFQFALCVGPAVPASVKTVVDFASWCKVNPEKASFGSPGEGTMGHFAGFMVAQAAHFKMTHVAYKGSAPALQDLLGGHIPASMQIVSEVIQYVNDGRLRALATTGQTRSLQLGAVPTMKEAGFPDVIAEEYFAIFAPARTPLPIVNQLSELLAEAIKSLQVSEQLLKLGFEPAPSDAQSLEALLREDLARWGPIVKASGFIAT